jgi:hypothetical protein
MQCQRFQTSEGADADGYLEGAGEDALAIGHRLVHGSRGYLCALPVQWLD